MDIFTIVSFFFAFLLGIAIHESAHAWMGNKLGDPTAKNLGRISLNPIRHIDLIGTIALPLISLLTSLSLIGWAKPTPYNPANLKDGARDEIFIAIAGPIANLLLAGIATILIYISTFVMNMFGVPDSFDWIINFLFSIVLINFSLAFFNLLPIPPLDGSSLLRALLPTKFETPLAFLNQYGIIILMMTSFTPAGNILGKYLDTCINFSLKLTGLYH